MSTKKVTLMDLFSIVDGRLSHSGMKSVYDILGYICGYPGIMTHQLPVANDYVREHKPEWYEQVEKQLNAIKAIIGNEFEDIMNYIKANNEEYEISPLPAELLTDETFGNYMVENSLLLKKISQ